MLLAYRNYCDSPSNQTAQLLLEALIDSDIQNHQELIDIWAYGRRKQHGYVQLNTSGSTSGLCRQYTFGPMAEFWIVNLERTIKFPKYNKPIFISSNLLLYPLKKDCVSLMSAPKDSPRSAYIVTTRFNRRNVDELISKIDGITTNESILWADPNVWLYLTSDNDFCSFLERKSNISLLSTNWESFYKKQRLQQNGVYINDNMIDWYSGFNFFTCKYGSKHALPLFAQNDYGVVNLLNLTGDIIEASDLLVPTSKCICGKTKIAFIPHLKTQIKSYDGRFLYNLDLVERFQSVYQHMQFIQHQNLISVLYCGEMNEHDKAIINDFITNQGFDCELVENKFLKVSSKLPVFYNNLVGVPISDIPPENL